MAPNVPLTRENAIVGTIDYMSPEQAESSHAVDPRSDIYSLGCTLHYLLTGGPLHAGDGAVQRILAHREKPAPSLQESGVEVSEDVDAVFQRMVARKPAHRYPSMSEVIQALQQVAASSAASKTCPPVQAASGSRQDSAIAGTTVPVMRPARRPVRRGRAAARRWLWAAGTKARIALLSVLIYLCGTTVGPVPSIRPGTLADRKDKGTGFPTRLPRTGITGTGHAHLSFDAPVPGTLRDKNGKGTGFTTRLPGTGHFLPENDPHLQWSPGALFITSTYANFHYRGVNLGAAEAPGFLLRAEKTEILKYPPLCKGSPFPMQVGTARASPFLPLTQNRTFMLAFLRRTQGRPSLIRTR